MKGKKTVERNEARARRLHWLTVVLLVLLGTASFLDPKLGKFRPLPAMIFYAVAVAGGGYPWLRRREQEGIRFGTGNFRGHRVAGVLVKVSSANLFLFGIGSLLLAVLLGLYAYGQTGADAMKGWLGVVVFGGAFVVLVYSLLRDRHGILLTGEGIVWSRPLDAPVFVAWENIVAARIFQKKDRYTSAPAIGVAIAHESGVQTTLGTLGSMRQRRKAEGYELSFARGELLYRIESLEELMKFYLENTHLRSELDTGVALDRFKGQLAKTSLYD